MHKGSPESHVTVHHFGLHDGKLAVKQNKVPMSPSSTKSRLPAVSSPRGGGNTAAAVENEGNGERRAQVPRLKPVQQPLQRPHTVRNSTLTSSSVIRGRNTNLGDAAGTFDDGKDLMRSPKSAKASTTSSSSYTPRTNWVESVGFSSRRLPVRRVSKSPKRTRGGQVYQGVPPPSGRHPGMLGGWKLVSFEKHMTFDKPSSPLVKQKAAHPRQGVTLRKEISTANSTASKGSRPSSARSSNTLSRPSSAGSARDEDIQEIADRELYLKYLLLRSDQ
uniref:Uncharacterized protein n=1 Tax=Palpitomonas bilix TaxID=652834 RepID=A0A7S3LT70_9EUKA|mmetsp:Transcript_45571/g.117789  ORF Transcript_45571/g.117789 Transcript_45571/m.117789 type:complete len:276 (+) Transcript_45571:247-1074(+)